MLSDVLTMAHKQSADTHFARLAAQEKCVWYCDGGLVARRESPVVC